MDGAGDIPISLRKEPFPVKLSYMIDEAERNGKESIISWRPHGRAFFVSNPKAFADVVLPRQDQVPSVTYKGMQQLLTFNFCYFRQMVSAYKAAVLPKATESHSSEFFAPEGSDKGSYYHEFFLRGQPKLAYAISRMAIKGNGARKPVSQESQPDFYLLPTMTSERSAPVVSNDQRHKHLAATAAGAQESKSGGIYSEYDSSATVAQDKSSQREEIRSGAGTSICNGARQYPLVVPRDGQSTWPASHHMQAASHALPNKEMQALYAPIVPQRDTRAQLDPDHDVRKGSIMSNFAVDSDHLRREDMVDLRNTIVDRFAFYQNVAGLDANTHSMASIPFTLPLDPSVTVNSFGRYEPESVSRQRLEIAVAVQILQNQFGQAVNGYGPARDAQTLDDCLGLNRGFIPPIASLPGNSSSQAFLLQSLLAESQPFRNGDSDASGSTGAVRFW
jgi:hypothetical protein